MEPNNKIKINQGITKIHPELTCIVCQAFLFSTDHGNHETTYHCSSPEARFWDFERGSVEQIKAKEHWDKSRIEVFTTESNSNK